MNQAVTSKDQVISSSPTEYLPPLDTGDRQIQQQEKGEPEYAPQPILSVPPEADNHTQTIITPPDVKLNHDVPLPNVVSWTQMPGPVPLAARAVAEINLPASPMSVVAPPPDVARAMQHQGPSLQQAVVAPPPALQELNTRGLQSPQGAVVAPPPVQKVDPAYPLELMRRNVQGTVTLYAIIRSDGSVGDVRVLQGVDDRLDAYARAALTHWRFQPATKNGNAVDLEAVVAIPFRVSRTRSGF